MKENTQKKLELWASLNNWRSSHPSDTERFWDFVIEAFKSEDIEISEEEFYSVLLKYYSDEDVLTESYRRYEDGIDLLRQYSSS